MGVGVGDGVEEDPEPGGTVGGDVLGLDIGGIDEPPALPPPQPVKATAHASARTVAAV
ncbi:MAG: hypothetical protein JO359_09985 [Candidatus Eremiobacteraeota bacterium]|nr:hypothetical protein [Candidatus Eremiobacteraeota bacterium]